MNVHFIWSFACSHTSNFSALDVMFKSEARYFCFMFKIVGSLKSVSYWKTKRSCNENEKRFWNQFKEGSAKERGRVCVMWLMRLHSSDLRFVECFQSHGIYACCVCELYVCICNRFVFSYAFDYQILPNTSIAADYDTILCRSSARPSSVVLRNRVIATSKAHKVKGQAATIWFHIPYQFNCKFIYTSFFAKHNIIKLVMWTDEIPFYSTFIVNI